MSRDGMKSWRLRIPLIVGLAGLVATLLPGIRERIAADRCLDRGGVYDYVAHACRTDVQTLPSGPSSLLRAPDAGSIVIALIVAMALARIFITVDRRARTVGKR
ncbi:MAG TPA: hypothetical protein VFT29_05130 [Gemmatimonadaceae bacterium]|nr:hypothetical protein [Gemmatimonadaceae bacterium]